MCCERLSIYSPQPSGGALIFYFLIGANSEPVLGIGVTGLLVLHLFMESVLFELPEITFETLVTIAFLRFVLPRIDLRTTGRAVFVAVAFGTCHILFGPWGFGILSYGGASMLWTRRVAHHKRFGKSCESGLGLVSPRYGVQPFASRAQHPDTCGNWTFVSLPALAPLAQGVLLNQYVHRRHYI